jgi:hypothetical protein
MEKQDEDCSIWNNDRRHAQRLTGYACIAFGILLMVWLNAMVSFIRPGGLLTGILY